MKLKKIWSQKYERTKNKKNYSSESTKKMRSKKAPSIAYY